MLALQYTVEYLLFALVTVCLTGSCSLLGHPASWESIILHIASLRKDENSKSDVRFPLNARQFSTIIK